MQTTATPDGTIVITGATPEQKRNITALAQGHTTPPNLGNIKDVCELLGGCSTKTVERLVEAGHIKQIRFSQRRIRYDLDEVAKFARNGVGEMEAVA